MWHYRHMLNPRDVTPQSIMPIYKWLVEQKIDYASLPDKLRAMKTLGVPYSDEEINNGIDLALAQAKVITQDLMNQGVPAQVEDKELISLISYLQRLGKDYGSLPVTAQ